MQILTPTGYKDILDLSIGDEVTCYPWGSNVPTTNIIEGIDPWDHSREDFYELDENGDEGEAQHVPFTTYLINGKYKIFKYQSIWRGTSTVHATDLKVGDTIYDDQNQDLVITSIEETDEFDVWYRMTISGDHSYITDGITVHNASRYWVGGGASANWNATSNTNWGSVSGVQDNSSVPGTSDAVFLDGFLTGASDGTISASITINSLDCTGYVNTLTHNSAVTLTCSGTTVNFKLVSGMTYTLGSVTSSKITFSATSGTVSFTTAGKTCGDITKTGAGGTVIMVDALVCGATSTLTLTSGTFDAGNQNITTGKIAGSNTNTRAYTMGSGTWDIQGTGSVWNIPDTTNLTVTANTSTIQFSDSSATSRAFYNGSSTGTPVTLGNFKITAGSGTFTQSGVSGSVASTLKCANFDLTGFTGTYSRGGDQSGSGIDCSGSFTLGTGMTMTSLSGTLTMTSTASGKTFTSNGVTYGGSINFSGVGGVWTLQDALNITSSYSVSLNNGTLDTNGKAVTCGQFSISGSSTRTCTLGASAITCTSWLATTVTALTFNSNTSSISTSNNAIFQGGGKTYNNVTISVAGNTCDIGGANTFANLTINGTDRQNAGILVGATQTVTSTLTIAGFAQNARVFIASGTAGGAATLGTATTISAATTTLSNVDFADITGTGGGSWSGTSIGNCGGCTGITFTGAVNRYWVGNGGNFSDTAHWASTSGGASGATFPLPQDTAFFDANSFSSGSQTITKDQRAFPSVNFTGVTNTPAFNCFTNTSLQGGFYGSCTLVSGMTLTGTSTQTFYGRGSYTLTTAGISLPASIILNAKGGTLTLQDALVLTSPKNLTITQGTFDAGNQNVTCDTLNSTNTNTRTITMGSGTWEMTGATTFDLGDCTNLTLNANTSTLKFSYSGGSSISCNLATTNGTAPTLGNFKVTAGSGTFTIAQAASSALKVANLDTTGFVGTFAYSTNTINISGSMTIGSGSLMSGSGTITMSSTASGKTITTNGVTLSTSPLTFNGVGGVWTLGSALTLGSTVALTLTNGAFDTGGYAVSIGNFSSSNSNIRTLTITNSTITLGGVNTVWTTSTTTNLTFTATGSTIKITDTSATAKTWTGGSLTYGTLWFAKGTGTSTDTLNGSNTFSTLKNDGTVAWLLKFANSSTTTIASAGGWLMSGTASNLLSMTSVTAATAWNLSVASGNVSCDYVSLKDSHAAGGASFYAGSHSTDVSGNTGWSFTDAPVGSSSNFFMLF